MSKIAEALRELVECDKSLRRYIVDGVVPQNYDRRCQAAFDSARAALAEHDAQPQPSLSTGCAVVDYSNIKTTTLESNPSFFAEVQVIGGCNAWCYDPSDCVDGCKQQAMREAKDAEQAAIVKDAKRYRERDAQPQQEPMTNTATDAIEGYKAGLAGGAMGFVSAAFDCGWTHGAQERAELSEALRNAFKAHYGDERGRTADANRAFDAFAAGWQAALALRQPLTDEQSERAQD